MAFVGNNELEQYATGYRSILLNRALLAYHVENSIIEYNQEIEPIVNEDIADADAELARLRVIIGNDAANTVEEVTRHLWSPPTNFSEYPITLEDAAHLYGELIEEGDEGYDENLGDYWIQVRFEDEIYTFPDF